MWLLTKTGCFYLAPEAGCHEGSYFAGCHLAPTILARERIAELVSCLHGQSPGMMWRKHNAQIKFQQCCRTHKESTRTHTHSQI